MSAGLAPGRPGEPIGAPRPGTADAWAAVSGEFRGDFWALPASSPGGGLVLPRPLPGMGVSPTSPRAGRAGSARGFLLFTRVLLMPEEPTMRIRPYAAALLDDASASAVALDRLAEMLGDVGLHKASGHMRELSKECAR